MRFYIFVLALIIAVSGVVSAYPVNTDVDETTTSRTFVLKGVTYRFRLDPPGPKTEIPLVEKPAEKTQTSGFFEKVGKFIKDKEIHISHEFWVLVVLILLLGAYFCLHNFLSKFFDNSHRYTTFENNHDITHDTQKSTDEKVLI